MEKDIVAAILRYLKQRPLCFAWKTHGGMYGTAGIPDIIACVDGRFYAFEVKQPGGQLSRLQEETLKKIEAAGDQSDLHPFRYSAEREPERAGNGATIVKIVDLENEINEDIDTLVDLKREIVDVIKRIQNSEYQTLLELRYLCFYSWEKAAVEMVQYMHKFHRKALEQCSAFIPAGE